VQDKILFFLALMALVPCVALATPPADGETTVIDTSLFVAQGADLRSFRKQVTVRATPSQVFAAWTTAEGLQAFLDVQSRVELRIGGPYELYFMPDTPDGPIGSNGCQVLAYVPDSLLVFSWNASPEFPDERALRTWVVLRFEQVDGGTTVELTHLGFGRDGRWNEVLTYFEAAWDKVLAALLAHFEG